MPNSNSKSVLPGAEANVVTNLECTASPALRDPSTEGGTKSMMVLQVHACDIRDRARDGPWLAERLGASASAMR